ncbi:bacteriocin [uncultured Phascolarctobacterium sp.]|uniref:bacteriocin n=1 Tax=uncultured Phascolarctobacterium sp. TaxID=512296 RepID=UPI00262A8308|nr:bacteriocin [uncultured Phascolarctobacterium sp.]
MTKKDEVFIEPAKVLSDEELDAVVGGTQSYYSVGEITKGEYGEYRMITYYDENKKETAHLDCPLGKVDAMIERLNKRGLSAL